LNNKHSDDGGGGGGGGGNNNLLVVMKGQERMNSNRIGIRKAGFSVYIYLSIYLLVDYTRFTPQYTGTVKNISNHFLKHI
jgi:hypothetical protein